MYYEGSNWQHWLLFYQFYEKKIQDRVSNFLMENTSFVYNLELEVHGNLLRFQFSGKLRAVFGRAGGRVKKEQGKKVKKFFGITEKQTRNRDGWSK